MRSPLVEISTTGKISSTVGTFDTNDSQLSMPRGSKVRPFAITSFPLFSLQAFSLLASRLPVFSLQASLRRF